MPSLMRGATGTFSARPAQVRGGFVPGRRRSGVWDLERERSGSFFHHTHGRSLARERERRERERRRALFFRFFLLLLSRRRRAARSVRVDAARERGHERRDHDARRTRARVSFGHVARARERERERESLPLGAREASPLVRVSLCAISQALSVVRGCGCDGGPSMIYALEQLDQTSLDERPVTALDAARGPAASLSQRAPTTRGDLRDDVRDRAALESLDRSRREFPLPKGRATRPQGGTREVKENASFNRVSMNTHNAVFLKRAYQAAGVARAARRELQACARARARRAARGGRRDAAPRARESALGAARSRARAAGAPLFFSGGHFFFVC